MDGSRPVGDSILKAVGTVTLGSWSAKQWAAGFFIPELVEEVKQAPKDLTRRVWLGTRLRHLEVTKARFDRSWVRSPTAYVTRPLVRAGARALASDSRSSSDKVLAPTFGAAAKRVRGEVVDARALVVLGRIYALKGDPVTAWQLADAAIRAPKPAADAYYLGAEAAYDCKRYADAQVWAAMAVERGCSLGNALLGPNVGLRRAAYHSTAGDILRPVNAMHFWKMHRSYYERATEADLLAWFGPMPAITVGGSNF
jgi:hypothetical protein